MCALYPDPVKGYPPRYARDSIPKITSYPDGQLAPTPSGLDFTPGQLLGCVSGELGLRKFLESRGHSLFVTTDKDGPGCALEKELEDAEIVISQPFYPFYLTEVRCDCASVAVTCSNRRVGWVAPARRCRVWRCDMGHAKVAMPVPVSFVFCKYCGVASTGVLLPRGVTGWVVIVVACSRFADRRCWRGCARGGVCVRSASPSRRS